LETSLDVFGYYSIKVSSFKGKKKLGLSNIVDISLDEGLKLLAIRLLQHTKTTNIK